MDNDKWVWADSEDLPLVLPSLDSKLTPVAEWISVTPDPTAAPEPEKAEPEKTQPQNGAVRPPLAAAPPRPPAPPLPPAKKKEIPPSLVKAIVLHLEGKLDEAIQEIQAGLVAGEPPAELHAAIGALQMEIERYDDAAASFRQVLDREAQPFDL